MSGGQPESGAPGTARPAQDRRFPKDRRVRRRPEYQQIFERGARYHGRFLTLIVLANGTASCRLGIVASRKLGGAIVRNRAKRRIREMFRQHLPDHQGPGVDAIVIPRRELAEAPPSSLTEDFKRVWRRAAGRVAAHARG